MESSACGNPIEPTTFPVENHESEVPGLSLKRKHLGESGDRRASRIYKGMTKWQAEQKIEAANAAERLQAIKAARKENK